MGKRFSKQKTLKYLLYISVLVGIIFFIICIMPVANGDEAFSMLLIHHTYPVMLHLSYFDVHPPLYYLILKTFLIITTFWTKSILIKIIFAKLFSLICFFITFITLYSILKDFKIQSNIYIQLILCMITLPTLIIVTQIRMYALATTFLSLELKFLIKFIESKKNYYLVFITMFAGSLLLIYFIQMLRIGNRKNYYKFVFCIISFILLFIPCFWFASRQIIYVSSSNYSNIGDIPSLNKNIFIQLFSALSGINFFNIGEVILGIFIATFLIYLTIYYFRITFKNSPKLTRLLENLILSFSISVIIPLIFSIVYHPILQGRYFYPLIFIYEFILIGIIVKYTNFEHISKQLLLLFSSLGNLAKIKKNYNIINSMAIPSYKIISHVTDSHHNIQLSGKSNNILEESLYMEYKPMRNKLCITENNKNVRGILGKDNKYLLYNLISNMHIKYTD